MTLHTILKVFYLIVQLACLKRLRAFFFFDLSPLTIFSKPNRLFAHNKAITQINEAPSIPSSTILGSSGPNLRLALDQALGLALTSILLSIKELFKPFMQIYIKIVQNQV